MAIQVIRRLLRLRDVNADDIEDGETLIWDADNSEFIPGSGGGGGGAPTDATYLVATADSTLSAEVVVGATPGGELGGTWASPTVDASHSGSTHAAVQAAAEATAAAALSAHTGDTSDAHDASAISVDSTTLVGVGTDVQAVLEELDNGIADHLADSSAAHAASAISFSPTGNLAATDAQAAIAEAATDAASALSTHESDTTSVHGITDTSALYRSGGTDVALADGGTGASLADPNADRIVFWDDSAGAVTWLTAGSGLSITDTTITATGSGIAESLIDAKGDLIVGTADNTAARLAVSATQGMQLTVDTNETPGVKWARDARKQIEFAGRGLIGETLDEKCANLTGAPAAGTLVVGAVGFREGDVVTGVAVHVTGNASSATLVKVALYDTSGNLLASSADVDSTFNAGSTPRKQVTNFSSPYTILADGMFYIGYLSVGGTGATVLRANSNASAAISGSALPYAAQASLSDLPNPATLVAASNSVWLGAV